MTNAKCENKISTLTLAAGAAVFVLTAGLMPKKDPLSSSSSPSSSNKRATLWGFFWLYKERQKKRIDKIHFIIFFKSVLNSVKYDKVSRHFIARFLKYWKNLSKCKYLDSFVWANRSSSSSSKRLLLWDFLALGRLEGALTLGFIPPVLTSGFPALLFELTHWSCHSNIQENNASYCTVHQILVCSSKILLFLFSYLIIAEEGAGHSLTELRCGGFSLIRFWFRCSCRCKQILKCEEPDYCNVLTRKTSKGCEILVHYFHLLFLIIK